MKKLIVLWIVLFSLLLGNMETKAASIPELYSPYAVSIDAITGEVLLDKGMNQRAFPASITKVLTALLLMENTKPTDEIVMTKEALAQDKSNYIIELKEGERLSRDTALDIMMILSANDVAYAIGEHLGGTVENYKKMMNDRIQKLGLKNTHFVTASGLHDKGHYTTPYDMALIVKEAIKNPRIVEAMSTKRKMIKTSQQEVSIFNRCNAFELPGFYAAKNGYTEEALNTLTEVATKDGKKVINVVMKSNKYHYYDDMKKITDYAFKQLNYKKVVEKGSTLDKPVTFMGQVVDVKADDDVGLFLKNNNKVEIQTEVKQAKIEDEYLYEQGIRENNVVGELIVRANEVEVGRSLLRAAKPLTFDKPMKLKVEDETKVVKPVLKYAVVGGSVFMVVAIGLVARRKRKNKNKYYF